LSADDINALIATSDDLRESFLHPSKAIDSACRRVLPIGGILGNAGYILTAMSSLEVNGGAVTGEPPVQPDYN